MGFFDDEMPELKLGDLDNIPCASRKVSGGRAIVARKYPNRDGQSTEDLGREPYTFELEIPLFHDIDPNHYPTMWDQLRLVLDDPPDALEFRDHELGTMQVSIASWSSDLVAEKRDGVLVHLTITEDLLDTPFQVRELVSDVPNAEGAGADLDQALEDAGVDEDDTKAKLDKAGVGLKADEQSYTAGDMWAGQGSTFSQRFTDGVVTAALVGASIDAMRGRVDVLLGLPQLQLPQNAGAVNAAMMFASAVALAGSAALASSTPIVEEAILDTCSVFEVAARLYGSTDRVAELLQRNPLVDPLFIRAGTKLLVAA